MFAGLPKSARSPTPPPAQRIATGSSEMPMTVMTDPVTTGGKKRSRRLNTPRQQEPDDPGDQDGAEDALQPADPAACAVPMASIEATAANEVPCTIGSLAPIRQTPRVCSSVASPDTSSAAVSR